MERPVDDSSRSILPASSRSAQAVRKRAASSGSSVAVSDRTNTLRDSWSTDHGARLPSWQDVALAISRDSDHIEAYGAQATTNAIRSRTKGSAAAIKAKEPPTQVPSSPLRL